MVAFHREEVLAESVHEMSTSFLIVHSLTTDKTACVKYTSRDTAVYSFEVHTSVCIVMLVVLPVNAHVIKITLFTEDKHTTACADKPVALKLNE